MGPVTAAAAPGVETPRTLLDLRRDLVSEASRLDHPDVGKEALDPRTQLPARHHGHAQFDRTVRPVLERLAIVPDPFPE